MLMSGVDARFTSRYVVTWEPMNGRSGMRTAAAAVAGLALVAAATHTAFAAPDTDGQGFVDSWARCASPSTAVAFGSTDTSRVAICKSSDGQYQYRGVRVRDGARLAIDATPSGGSEFVAEGDGISYTVTPTALKVSAGDEVIRDEAWLTYSGPEAPASATTSTPTTSSTATSTTSTSSTATTTSTSATPTSTSPLPPPLPAEQGHT